MPPPPTKRTPRFSAAREIKLLKPLLAEFFKNNPKCEFEYLGNPARFVSIVNPWGDPSVSIRVRGEHDALIAILNSIYLPERFTAIWHLDTKLLEIIFTADPMPPMWTDLPKREFVFMHRGAEYKCGFRGASNELRQVAACALPRRPTRSGYRNLLSFQRYEFAKSGVGDITVQDDAVPLSFWVEGIDWDDDKVVDLVHHLNFYMTYYDNMSPLIIIHTPEDEAAASHEVTRYPFEKFPSRIASRSLDEDLVQFWIASREGDPVRRFIYNYQILEYAATYYIEENVRRSVRISLSAPHALDNIDLVTQQIIDAMGESKIQDPQKLEALLRQIVNPGLIWNEISKKIDLFSKIMHFDGGFEQAAIARSDWDVDHFKVNWCPAFPAAIRSIRNALSHGREQRSGAVILPTVGNFARLQAWVPLVAMAAREVMIYRGVT